MSDQPLLITGATGALGQQLVRELIEESDRTLYLLIRGKGRRSPEDRARKLLAPGGGEGLLGSQVRVVAGDVAQPGFGLAPRDRDRLRDEIGLFYHVAALTDLNAAEEPCRRINIAGTVEALRLARELDERGRFERLVYFSTAYVAGSGRPYHAFEEEMAPEPAHANAYESTKYEAERRVRGAMAEGLPVTIVRPSIVVGDSRTGEVTEFNVIYPFLKLYAHGILSILPAHPDDTFNVVPIDFVTRAVRALARRPDSVGKTYHLVADRPPSIGTLLKVKDVEFPTIPHIELVDPDQFAAGPQALLQSQIQELVGPYLGYLRCRLTFDTTNTRAALADTDVNFPKTDYDFLTRIVQYAVDRKYLLI